MALAAPVPVPSQEERMESPASRSPPSQTRVRKVSLPPPDASQLAPLVEDQFVCIECGKSFYGLPALRVHVQLKTAWSCASLVGCRICALVDNLEWHEGTVRSFHRSTGKHLVEFEARGEARWLRMHKTAFYVMREARPKEAETKEVDGLDAVDPRSAETYDYVEDISEDYCRAQSRLYYVYGCRVQETGHKTAGHLCITSSDKETASASTSCLLYGELLPRGVNKALSTARLRAEARDTLVDLGMGTGKVCVQAFLQYPNLSHVYGVELAESRYRLAENAARSLCRLFPREFQVATLEVNRVVVVSHDGNRRLEFELGSMFDTPLVATADIVLLETDVVTTCHDETCAMLRRMRPEAMLLSYLDLEMMWDAEDFPFVQHRDNRELTDRYPTSWSVSRGHHFFLWMRLDDSRLPASRGAVWRPQDLRNGAVTGDGGASCCLPFLTCFRSKKKAAPEAMPAPVGLAIQKAPQAEVEFEARTEEEGVASERSGSVVTGAGSTVAESARGKGDEDATREPSATSPTCGRGSSSEASAAETTSVEASDSAPTQVVRVQQRQVSDATE